MDRRVVRFLPLAIVLAASQACSPGAAVPTATPLAPPATFAAATEPPPATVALPPVLPSDTPIPTPEPTPTPTEVTLTPLSGNVACRFGPGTVFSIDGQLTAGKTTRALARSANRDWIRIEHETHPRWNCWVKAGAVMVLGNLESVPVEPEPTAFVTKVEVQMSPAEASVPGCVFPYTFTVRFWITVNGPATVRLQRSLSNGNSAPVETQVFTTSGRYEFTDSNKVGAAGDHWFQVEVTSPNAMTGRGTARAVCGP